MLSVGLDTLNAAGQKLGALKGSDRNHGVGVESSDHGSRGQVGGLGQFRVQAAAPWMSENAPQPMRTDVVA
jgi:hypothetical protein